MSDLLCSLFSVSDEFDEIKAADMVFFRKQFDFPIPKNGRKKTHEFTDEFSDKAKWMVPPA